MSTGLVRAARLALMMALSCPRVSGNDGMRRFWCRTLLRANRRREPGVVPWAATPTTQRVWDKRYPDRRRRI
jgi:hypothetical protein